MKGTGNISAACKCGQLSVTARSAAVLQLVCHCADCRAMVRRPFTEIAFFLPTSCEIHGSHRPQSMAGGSGKVKTYYSCEACGTCLFARVDLLNGAVGIVADRLVPFSFKPLCHVWTSESAPESRISRFALRFSKAPPQLLRSALLWYWKQVGSGT